MVMLELEPATDPPVEHLKTSFSRRPNRGTTLHQLETSVASRLGQQQVLEPVIPAYKGIGGKVCNKLSSLTENTENAKKLSRENVGKKGN